MGLPKKPLTKTQKLAQYIHDKVLGNYVYAGSRKTLPFMYGELRAILSQLSASEAKKLVSEYHRSYKGHLQHAIGDRFGDDYGYAQKLIKLLDEKIAPRPIPKKPDRKCWSTQLRTVAEARLNNTSLWPRQLPANISIYKKNSALYKQFRLWGEWFLKNCYVLSGPLAKRAGVAILPPSSPFPKSTNDQNFGDLEFFKDLHMKMNQIVREYSQKCDTTPWGLFPGVRQSHQESKARIVKRCMPDAKALLALFKRANKGTAGRNMLAKCKGEVEKLEGWQKEYGHLLRP